MGVFEATVLGAAQGFTEFLPISSDGHLWIVYRIFGENPSLTFEVFLHFATLLVLIAYFWRDIVHLLASLLPANREQHTERRLVLLIFVGTLVSGAIAAFMRSVVEAANASAVWVGLGFLLTAAFMVVAEVVLPRVKRVAATGDLPLWKAVPIGILQAVAVLPGVSRSGSTISGGMYSGLSRSDATRFSFLLGIPIIALATLKDGFDIITGNATLPGLGPSIAGFITAAACGYLAIWGLLRFVKRHRLYWFAAYTAVLGTAILVWTLV